MDEINTLERSYMICMGRRLVYYHRSREDCDLHERRILPCNRSSTTTADTIVHSCFSVLNIIEHASMVLFFICTSQKRHKCKMSHRFQQYTCTCFYQWEGRLSIQYEILRGYIVDLPNITMPIVCKIFLTINVHQNRIFSKIVIGSHKYYRSILQVLFFISEI